MQQENNTCKTVLFSPSKIRFFRKTQKQPAKTKLQKSQSPPNSIVTYIKIKVNTNFLFLFHKIFHFAGVILRIFIDFSFCFVYDIIANFRALL